MALGPGKYDSICTEAREKTKAEGVVLIVVNGSFGHGFSCQATLEVIAGLPQLLRTVADDMERSAGRA